MPEHAADPPRSTVYNSMRQGRVRMDAEMLRDIVLALGETPERAEAWVERCQRVAQRSARSVPPLPVPVPVPVAAARESRTVLQGLPLAMRRGLCLLACVALNFVGHGLAWSLELTLFLDMTGTALAAILLGPWWGALVAVATSIADGLVIDQQPAFMLVGIAGALVWGYGVQRFGMGESLTRFFLLNVLVAVVCSATATPILVMLYGGSFGSGQTFVTSSLLEAGWPGLAATFSAKIVTSLID